MVQHPTDVRVSEVKGLLHRALVDCVRRWPDVTEEEMLAALLDVAAHKTQRLRVSKRTSVGEVMEGDAGANR
jgi:hypothetical protein